MGFALPQSGPAPARDGWRRTRQSAALYDRGRLAAFADRCACRRCAARRRREGFGGSKIKVGRPAARGRRAAWPRCRAAVGADFEIFTDANQAFTVEEAIRRARLYEAADIGWFEEPLPADDVEGHAGFRARRRFRSRSAKASTARSQFRDYLQRGACSIVQVDVARIGGITPWLKTAHLAETFNVRVCPHFLMELHVALCCAVPNARWLEYIPQLDDITAERMTIDKGYAFPSAAPGLGIDWNFEAIERLTVDGSLRRLGKSE